MRLPIIFLAASCVLIAPARAADNPAKGLQPLTIEEATADTVSWGLNLSPSGRYLAALRKQDKTNLVAVADLDSKGAAPFVYPVPDGDIRWVEWASDDRLLFAVEFWADGVGRIVPVDDIKKRYVYRVARIFAMDRDGKNMALLFAGNRDALATRNLTRVTALLRDDPRHIVMPAWSSTSFDLFRVDVYTGQSQLIAEGTDRTRIWFTDRDGAPAFRADVNWLGSLLYVYARKGPVPADPGDLEWEKIRTIPLRDEQNQAAPDFYPLLPGPEASTYYVAARPEGTDTTGIYLYDYIAKKYLKTLASEPGIDIEEVIVDRDTRAYLGVHYYTDRRVTRIIDPSLQAHFTALDKYFGGEVDLYLSDYADDQSAWLLYTWGPRDRGSWHIYRLKDKDVRSVAFWLPVIDPERLGTKRVVRYKARDGLEIMGYLTVPPGPPAGTKPPLIMLPHGGPEMRDDYSFDTFAQMLASRGYQVFQPNFRGSSGFGKQFAEAGHRQWGRAMQDDLTDGFEFLVKSGFADRDRACIVGASYGGYAALAAATLTPELFRCAASIAGVADLREQLGFYWERFKDDPETWAEVKRQIGDPRADRTMLDAHSPARKADAVKVPVLLIHGEQDGIVPIEQSELMDKALRKAGKDVRFVRLKDVPHHLGNDEWKLVYPPLLEFLEQHLPATASATRQSSR